MLWAKPLSEQSYFLNSETEYWICSSLIFCHAITMVSGFKLIFITCLWQFLYDLSFFSTSFVKIWFFNFQQIHLYNLLHNEHPNLVGTCLILFSLILLVLIKLLLLFQTLSQNHQRLPHTDTKTQIQINAVMYLQALLFFHKHSYLIQSRTLLMEPYVITIFTKRFIFFDQFFVLKITEQSLSLSRLVLLQTCKDIFYCYQY